MSSNQAWLLGREGERIAAEFLERKGYRIVERNFRFHRNEIDACISRVTKECVNGVAPSVSCNYIPHCVDPKVFVSMPDDERRTLRTKILPAEDQDKFILFWNNRNARRKQSGSVLWWFAEWVKERDLSGKVQLIMHTNPADSHGQDLQQIATHLGLENREVMFSTKKVALVNAGFTTCRCHSKHRRR